MGQGRTISFVEYEPGEDEAPIGQQLVTSANHLAVDTTLCAFTVLALYRKDGTAKCLGAFDAPESMRPEVFRAMAKMLTDHAADLHRMANKAEAKR